MKRFLALLATAALPFAAGGFAAAAQTSDAAASAPAARPAPLAQFAPRPDGTATRIDFAHWDKALRWFVLRMGPSTREYAGRPDPTTGTRALYGHDSAYRLEGNRIAFSYFTDEVRQALGDYRRELETLPERVPLTRLPRNEQLAFWINLHNVAVIEQIAQAYPVARPSLIRLDGSALPLDETPFLIVGGARLSPKDIRTRIVYPHWRDAKVIYGFWRGEIGGPSIARSAYSGDNVDALLGENAREFVNSLRGTQRDGDLLLVSELYREAAPFYFADWNPSLRAHLRRYSEPPVAALIDATRTAEARLWEADIADLSKGERETEIANLEIDGKPVDFTIDGTIRRLLAERQSKLEKLAREGALSGRVVVDAGQSGPPPEVD